MRHTCSVAEVADHFIDYVNRVADHGEYFVLMRDTEPVAELRPAPAMRRLEELPALLESIPRLSDDEAASFGEDLAASRSDLDNAQLHDPWQS